MSFDNVMLLSTLLPILIIGVTAMVVLPLLTGLLRNGSRNRFLLQNGQAAQASILKVWQTNVSMNDKPQFGFLLLVQPPQGQPFQAEAKMFVSLIQLVQIQPSTLVEVKYDPADKTKVAISAFGISKPFYQGFPLASQ